VEPTELNPRCFRSLLNASDSVAVAGICFMTFQWFTLGCPPTKRHAYTIKTSELVLNSEKRPRVAYGRLDFLPVSNDPWIEQQLLNAFLCISRHFVGIELAESAAIAFTLVQDDRPAQSGLRPFQNKELEMFDVIVDRHAPFPIVIFEHQGTVCADPPASFLDHK